MKDLNAYLNGKINDNTDPINSFLNTNISKKKYSQSNLGSGEFLDYGEDISDTRYLDPGFTRFSPYDAHELQAQNQPWLHKAGSGVGRLGVKVLAEVAKMPGVLGGIAAAPFADKNQGWETAFNNSWIKSINEINENINKDILPVYVKKAVEEGNLWDNITSIDFWATEGADGVGYITSMMVPGAVLKGLGVGKYLLKIKPLQGVLSAKKADVITATVANTIMEAGAEAGNAMENFQKQMDLKLHNGEITPEQYEEMKLQKARLGRDIFLSNAVILAGPNALQANMLWGKTLNKSAGKLLDSEGKLIKSVVEPSILQKIGNRSKDVLKAGMSEGLWEEGMQMTVENMFTNSAKKGQLTDNPFNDFNISELGEAYLDTISSTEGQKAMFLGAFLGGGMQAYSGAKTDIVDRKATQSLLDIGGNAIDAFYKTMQNDLYNEDGSPNVEKVMEKFQSFGTIEQLNLMYNQAVQKQDKEALEKLRDLAATQLAYGFIMNEELGLEVLEEHLKASSQFDEIVQREQEAGNKTTKQDIINNVMNKAKVLEKAFTNFNDFAPSLINPTLNENQTQEDIINFTNTLRGNYITNKANINLNENTLSDLKKKRQDILEDLDLDSNLVVGDETIQKQEEEDSRLKQVTKEIKEVEINLNRLKKLDKNFWNKEHLQKNFDRFTKEQLKLAEETVPEKAQELDEIITKINNSETPEDLNDNLNVKDKEYSKIKQLYSSIETDDSLDNLKNILEVLKNSEFNNYDVQKLIKNLESRIITITKEKETFKKTLESVIEEYMKNSEKVFKELQKVENKINTFEKLYSEIEKILNSKPDKILGRNAKKLKEFYTKLQEELDSTEETINKLKEQKLSLENQLKDIDKKVDYIFTELNQTEYSDFRNVQDIIKYLEDNKEDFKEHRFELERLLLHQFYTKENIQGLANSITYLEKYKDVLEKTIRLKLNSIENYSEDLYYLNEELQDLLEELPKLKQNLILEKDKLKRLEDSILDLNIKDFLSEEIEFWNNLQKVKKFKPKTVFNNPIIEKLIIDKEEELRKKEELKNELARLENDENFDAKEINLMNVLNNLVVGDIFTITDNFKAPSKFTNEVATITKRTDTHITVEIVKEGKPVGYTFNISNLAKNLNKFKVFEELSTEGGEDTIIEQTKQFDVEKPNFTTNGSKVISVDDNGNPLEFLEKDFPGLIEFERNPNIKKVGQKVTFEINTSYTNTENARLALAAFNAKDFSNLDLLINYLPINIVFENGQKAPLETYYTNKEGNDSVFKNSSKILRTSILKELQKGTDIKILNSVVEGQYNGELQIEPEYVENKIYDLYQFGGKIENIKPSDIYVVDNQGVLKNTEGRIFTTNRSLAPGHIYIKINTANGKEFPLKLNVSRITEQQAEVLYELYKYRFEDIKNNSKSLTLGEIQNPELIKQIKENLQDELKVIDKKFEDILIKDIVDFLIWDGTDSIKSRVKFTNTKQKVTKLAVMNKMYTAEEFLNSKEEFITKLTNNKRQHIKFKAKEDSGVKAIHIKNPKYLNYLLSKGVLNTNAKVGIHTFQGRTNMYINSYSLKVGEEFSIFNPEKKLEVNHEKLIGNNNQLKQLAPGLFENPVSLNSEENVYVDSKGNKYQRVSTLKSNGKNLSTISEQSSIRGNFIDELFRKEFSSLTPSTKEQFIQEAKNILKKENSKKMQNNSSIKELQITDNVFEELYEIVQVYKQEFYKRDWLVFSTSLPLHGQLGNNGLFAGAMDLLIYDKKNKEFVIVDIKSATTSRTDSYKDETKDKFNYKNGDIIQQNAYVELFQQMTGKTISKVFILPLITAKESTTSFNVNNIKLDSELLLEVDTSKDIYTLKGITKTKIVKPKVETKKQSQEFEGVENNQTSDNQNLLKMFGATEIPKKEKVVSNTSDIVKDLKQRAYQGLVNNEIDEIKSGGRTYYIHSYGSNPTYVVIDKESGKYITDLNTIIDIVQAFNKSITLDSARINISKIKESFKKHNEIKVEKPTIIENNSKKIRKSENNSVSLQEEQDIELSNEFGIQSGIDLSAFGISEISTPKSVESVVANETPISDSFDFSKLSDEQAKQMLKSLNMFLRNGELNKISKDITNIIMNKTLNNQQKLEASFKLVEDEISSEKATELRKNCML